MRIRVKDGDVLTVVAEVGPNVVDPNGDYLAVAMNYRVVASVTPLLVLVPYADTPVRVTEAEMSQFGNFNIKEKL